MKSWRKEKHGESVLVLQLILKQKKKKGSNFSFFLNFSLHDFGSLRSLFFFFLKREFIIEFTLPLFFSLSSMLIVQFVYVNGV